MARFRNTRNGVVVDVDDDTAARLGAAYEPVKGESTPKKTAPKKAAAKKSDDE